MVEFYCDGSYTVGRRVGGYASVKVVDGKAVEFFHKQIGKSTANRAELLGLIKSLEWAQEEKEVTIFTDSMYLVKGYKFWLDQWIKKEWQSSKNKPIKNSDLWRKVLPLKKDNIKIQFVKGHSGNPHNELADALAKY